MPNSETPNCCEPSVQANSGSTADPWVPVSQWINIRVPHTGPVEYLVRIKLSRAHELDATGQLSCRAGLIGPEIIRIADPVAKEKVEKSDQTALDITRCVAASDVMGQECTSNPQCDGATQYPVCVSNYSACETECRDIPQRRAAATAS